MSHNKVEDTPIVSVVIPCFNQGQYLLQAIESVHLQTLIHSEIIVVDDGSTDTATLRVFEDLGGPRTSVLRQSNQGLPSARNAGTQASRGKYICCLDADDTLESTYLEKAVSLLECRPDIGFAYPWTRRFGLGEGLWLSEEFDLRKLIDRNLLTHPAVFRKKAWKAVGGFWDGLREGYEDWEFWINIAAAGFPGALIPEVLFNYRKHGHSKIDEAVAVHEELVGRIKSRHASLYEDRDRVDRIQSSFRDRLARTPFKNINQKHMFSRGVGPPLGLILTDLAIDEFPFTPLDPIIAGTDAPQEPEKFSLISSSAMQTPGDHSIPSGLASHYSMPAFLPRPCQKAFVENFIRTSNLQAIIMTPSFPFKEVLGDVRDAQPDVACSLYIHEDPHPGDFALENALPSLFDEILAVQSVPRQSLVSLGFKRSSIRALA